MAMLAEPRQRKRYNLVPRGKALYEDGDRFGTRMLEKMGWSKGKGLGARENGETEFVRIRYKNDSEGMGFEDRNDQWTQHDSAFNGLLKSLSNANSDEDTKQNVEEASATVGFGFAKKEEALVKLSGESLEEKSKKSRARVHYKKFTRGKDIAQYSVKDLANIFGKKSFEGVETELKSGENSKTNESSSSDEKKAEEEDKTYGITTISSGKSISDYFKTKMEQFRQKTKQSKEVGEDDDEETRMGFGFSCSSLAENSILENSGQEKPKKKNRKDKNKDRHDEAINLNQEQQEVLDESILHKKSKKKSKHREENLTETVETENTIVETDESVKPRKSKRKHQEVDTELNTSPAEDGDKPEKSKKKRKYQADPEEATIDTQLSEEQPKKKKRQLETEQAVGDTFGVLENVDEADCKKKKSKKSKRQGVEDPVETAIESEAKQKMKKHKKSKELLDDSIQTGSSTLLQPEENKAEISEEKKRKKSKRSHNDLEDKTSNVSDECDISEPPEQPPSKPKKSKKKSQDPDDDQPTSAILPSIQSQVPQSLSLASPKTNNEANEFRFPEMSLRKKRKKSKQNTNESSTSADQQQEPEEIDHDNYKLNFVTAEKFSHTDVDAFLGCNLASIVGYGLTENIKIEIIQGAMDGICLSKYFRWYNRNMWKEGKRSKTEYRKMAEAIMLGESSEDETKGGVEQKTIPASIEEEMQIDKIEKGDEKETVTIKEENTRELDGKIEQVPELKQDGEKVTTRKWKNRKRRPDKKIFIDPIGR